MEPDELCEIRRSLSQFEKDIGSGESLKMLVKAFAALRELENRQGELRSWVEVAENLIMSYYKKVVVPQVEQVTSEKTTRDDATLGYWDAVIKMFTLFTPVAKDDCRKRHVLLLGKRLRQLMDELTPTERENVKQWARRSTCPDVMIYIIRERATDEQIHEMLEALQTYIKLAVDVHRRIIAGGGALHADCEAALLEDGSRQEDVWGADWIPDSREVRFESLINIRPKRGNRKMTIEDAALRGEIERIVRERMD